MSEISREDAKTIISSALGCLSRGFDCVGKVCARCENDVSEDEVKTAMGKVISDMEKLEKIEKIIDEISDFDHEDCEFDLRMIKQILKGE